MTSKILESHSRPVVRFDVYNQQHREIFDTFAHTGTWSTSPVRFALEGDYEDIVTMTRDRMLRFYLDREFRSTNSFV
jgi:hypothetical protein